MEWGKSNKRVVRRCDGSERCRVLFASPHNHAQCNGASGQGGDGVLEEVAVLSARSKSEERIQESEQRTGESLYIQVSGEDNTGGRSGPWFNGCGCRSVVCVWTVMVCVKIASSLNSQLLTFATLLQSRHLLLQSRIKRRPRLSLLDNIKHASNVLYA